eukprot:1842600-Pyramimonas_sp.AAC.1
MKKKKKLMMRTKNNNNKTKRRSRGRKKRRGARACTEGANASGERTLGREGPQRGRAQTYCQLTARFAFRAPALRFPAAPSTSAI